MKQTRVKRHWVNIFPLKPEPETRF